MVKGGWPVTFMTGPVGTFYRQFGITMATSIVLSGIVALTLTPVLCAMILRPHTVPKRRGPLRRLLDLFSEAGLTRRDRALDLSDVSLGEIAERAGTQVFVYNAEAIRQRYRALDEACGANTSTGNPNVE